MISAMQIRRINLDRSIATHDLSSAIQIDASSACLWNVDCRLWIIASVNRLRQIDLPTRVTGVALWVVIGACCGAPVVWIVARLMLDWSSFAPALLDARSLEALARTIILNGLAALAACLLAIAPAVWIGSSRRPWLAITLVALPLLLPSIVVGYAWRESLNLLNWLPRPGSILDELRCSLTLSAWLWPVPALSMGIALRRMDRALLWHARIDGALFPVVIRLLLPAILVGITGVFVLASQEFSIYETTGILVVSVVVRQTFEDFNFDQSTRLIRAAATLLPLIILALCLALSALLMARRANLSDDLSTERTHLKVPKLWQAFAWIVTAFGTLGPIGALIVLHRDPFDVKRIIDSIGLNLLASAEYALTTAVVAFFIGVAACFTRQRALTLLACAIFLVGGQLVAIVLIRTLNDPAIPFLTDLYDSPLVATISNLSRFSWIVLATGLFTWQGGWRPLRDMASAEGASPGQTARLVILPMALPILLASTLIVMALSFTEVGATILIQPSGSIIAPIYRWFGVEPSGSIIPMLMTWVHIQRYDPLIEASVIVLICVLAMGLIASCIGRRVKLDE